MDNNNNTNNISEVICSRIAQLRKREKLSQETLAGMLGITFQAVSKWENNVSCPDISIIPDIAKIFNVSVGYLFGEDGYNENPSADSQEIPDNNENKTFEGKNVLKCDWENDNIIRVVVARGHKLIKSQELDENIKKYVVVQLIADINGGVIDSELTINIDEGVEILNSTFTAGANINCGDITEGGTMTAGANINCGDITEGGTITAGSCVNCGDITEGGTITAGGSINCGDISESGAISAGANIQCGDISECENITANGFIQCGDISECESIYTSSINCGDISDCGGISVEKGATNNTPPFPFEIKVPPMPEIKVPPMPEVPPMPSEIKNSEKNN